MNISVPKLLSTLMLVVACGATGACTVSDPCDGAWSVTVLDRQEEGPALLTGTFCVVGFGAECVPAPAPHTICAGGGFCGDPTDTVCLEPRRWRYALGDDADPARRQGHLELPPADGVACAARLHVNTAEPRLQVLSCGAGAFVEVTPGEP